MKEIPPPIKKILQKLSERGEVEYQEFRTIILNIRIDVKDLKELEKYLEKNQLIERKGNGQKDIIITKGQNAL
jgi:predicted transcriptional regulator